MAIAETVGSLIESNRDMGNADRLRGSMHENGYLYFRGAGPKEKIRDLRRVFLTFCREAGWLDPKADLMEGEEIAAGSRCIDQAAIQFWSIKLIKRV